MIYVKNLNGTSNRKCRHASWLEHYRKLSMETGRLRCVACDSYATLGGHVMLKENVTLLTFILWDQKESGHHIVPLCGSCNGTGDWMRAQRSFRRVSANTRLTGCYLAS